MKKESRRKWYIVEFYDGFGDYRSEKVLAHDKAEAREIVSNKFTVKNSITEYEA